MCNDRLTLVNCILPSSDWRAHPKSHDSLGHHLITSNLQVQTLIGLFMWMSRAALPSLPPHLLLLCSWESHFLAASQVILVICQIVVPDGMTQPQAWEGDLMESKAWWMPTGICRSWGQVYTKACTVQDPPMATMPETSHTIIYWRSIGHCVLPVLLRHKFIVCIRILQHIANSGLMERIVLEQMQHISDSRYARDGNIYTVTSGRSNF